jgi:hypothetical protein
MSQALPSSISGAESIRYGGATQSTELKRVTVALVANLQRR